jgi:hypothetical protein
MAGPQEIGARQLRLELVGYYYDAEGTAAGIGSQASRCLPNGLAQRGAPRWRAAIHVYGHSTKSSGREDRLLRSIEPGRGRRLANGSTGETDLLAERSNVVGIYTLSQSANGGRVGEHRGGHTMAINDNAYILGAILFF